MWLTAAPGRFRSSGKRQSVGGARVDRDRLSAAATSHRGKVQVVGPLDGDSLCRGSIYETFEGRSRSRPNTKRVGDPVKSLESKVNTHSGLSANTLLKAGSTTSIP